MAVTEDGINWRSQREMDKDIKENPELYQALADDPDDSHDEFDHEAFLVWLDDQEGDILASTLEEEWPNFPFGELEGCTGPIIGGDLYYYQTDLRTVAKGWRILD